MLNFIVLLQLNYWKKHFVNFKGLKESKTDLAFLLKSQALQLTQYIYPVCNSLLVIYHTFMAICLKLADFTYFFLPETLTSLLLHFILSVD